MPARPLTRRPKMARALPDTEETETWGKPRFRVNNKIFCGYGEEDGATVIGCTLEKKHALKVVKRPGLILSPFGGKHGWISIDVEHIEDWEGINDCILESYTLTAPKRSIAKL